jgi:hypothetical protein
MVRSRDEKINISHLNFPFLEGWAVYNVLVKSG